jgi:hypothetical protein
MTSRARGRGPDGLLAIARSLSPRDRQVLDAVARHRFLTTQQLERFVFHDHASALSAARTCRRVLRRLHQLDLVTPLERRVGGFGAGSATSIWHLAPVGARVLSFLSGDGLAPRIREPSVRFVAHTLAVAETHLRLIEAARTGRFELTSVQIEQESWRSYQTAGGTEYLKPDLAVVASTEQFEDHWFLEVDLGTEHLPTIQRKCQQYQAYRQTGTEQAASDIFPVVVWIAPTERRAAKLTAAILGHRTLDQALFRVIVMDQLTDLITGGAA